MKLRFFEFIRLRSERGDERNTERTAKILTISLKFFRECAYIAQDNRTLMIEKAGTVAAYAPKPAEPVEELGGSAELAGLLQHVLEAHLQRRAARGLDRERSAGGRAA